MFNELRYLLKYLIKCDKIQLYKNENEEVVFMDLDKTRVVSILLAVVFVVLMLLMAMTNIVGFGLAAIAVMIVCAVFQFKFWRCPTCGKGLGPLWVKYCPHCGEWLV